MALQISIGLNQCLYACVLNWYQTRPRGLSVASLCIQEAINSQGISWTMAAWLARTAQGGKREVQSEKRGNEREGRSRRRGPHSAALSQSNHSSSL